MRPIQPARGLPRPAELSPALPAHAVGRTAAILVAPLTAHSAGARGAAGPALPPRATRTRNPPRVIRHARDPVLGSGGDRNVARRSAVVARALGVRSLPAAGPGPARGPGRHRASAGGPPRRRPGFHRPWLRRLLDTEHRGDVGLGRIALPRGRHLRRRRERGLRAAQPQPDVGRRGVGGRLGLLPIYVGCRRRRTDAGARRSSPRRRRPRAPRPPTTPSTKPRPRGSPPATRSMTTWRPTTGQQEHAGGARVPVRLDDRAACPRLPFGRLQQRNSGVTDLVAANGTGFVEPDDIWIADWNGQENTVSSSVPSTDWANHQRLHQYQGGHNATYGGVTINIDSDYVDAGAASGDALFPNGTFVQVSRRPQLLRDRGWRAAAGQLLERRRRPAGLHRDHAAAVRRAQPGPEQWHADRDQHRRCVHDRRRRTDVRLEPGGVRQPSPLLVDQWNIDNIGNPLSPPNAVPPTGRS